MSLYQRRPTTRSTAKSIACIQRRLTNEPRQTLMRRRRPTLAISLARSTELCSHHGTASQPNRHALTSQCGALPPSASARHSTARHAQNGPVRELAPAAASMPGHSAPYHLTTIARQRQLHTLSCARHVIRHRASLMLTGTASEYTVVHFGIVVTPSFR